MVLVLDGSTESWALVAHAAGFATAFAYGAVRREHTRVWPILALGTLLNIVANVVFGNFHWSGRPLWVGFVLYPVYCMVACVVGILFRAALDRILYTPPPDRKEF